MVYIFGVDIPKKFWEWEKILCHGEKSKPVKIISLNISITSAKYSKILHKRKLLRSDKLKFQLK